MENLKQDHRAKVVEWKIVDTVGSQLRIFDCLELDKISKKGDSPNLTSRMKLVSLF